MKKGNKGKRTFCYGSIVRKIKIYIIGLGLIIEKYLWKKLKKAIKKWQMLKWLLFNIIAIFLDDLKWILFLKSFLYSQSLQKLCIIDLAIFIFITSFNNLINILTTNGLNTRLSIYFLYLILRNLATLIIIKPLENIMQVLLVLERRGLEATRQELIVIYLTIFICIDMIDDVL